MVMAQLAQREPNPPPQLPLPVDACKTYTASPLPITTSPRDQMPSTSWAHQLQGLGCRMSSGGRGVLRSACASCQCSQSEIDDSPTLFPHSARSFQETGQNMCRLISASTCCHGPNALRSPRHTMPTTATCSTAAHAASAKQKRGGTRPHHHKSGPRNLSGEAKHWDSWVPTLEFRRSMHIIRRNAALQPCSPRSGPFLPPKTSLMEGRCTLILDLDETLVRAQVEQGVHEDTSCTFVTGGVVHGVQVHIRPGAAAFLAILAEWFELVAFTASCQEYAEPVLDLLDPDGSIFSHRLFRDSCRRLPDGQFIKDLSMLGRDLRSTIIVDNTPSVYSWHLDNAVPISSWYCDPNDKSLLQLLPLLCHLANMDDVRSHLRRFYRLPDLIFSASIPGRSNSLHPLPGEALREGHISFLPSH